MNGMSLLLSDCSSGCGARAEQESKRCRNNHIVCDFCVVLMTPDGYVFFFHLTVDVVEHVIQNLKKDWIIALLDSPTPVGSPSHKALPLTTCAGASPSLNQFQVPPHEVKAPLPTCAVASTLNQFQGPPNEVKAPLPTCAVASLNPVQVPLRLHLFPIALNGPRTGIPSGMCTGGHRDMNSVKPTGKFG